MLVSISMFVVEITPPAFPAPAAEAAANALTTVEADGVPPVGFHHALACEAALFAAPEPPEPPAPPISPFADDLDATLMVHPVLRATAPWDRTIIDVLLLLVMFPVQVQEVKCFSNVAAPHAPDAGPAPSSPLPTHLSHCGVLEIGPFIWFGG